MPVFVLKNAPLIRELMDEVQQEVFCQLLDDGRRRLRLFEDREENSLARWIIIIANRTTLNFLRKKGFDGLMGQSGKVELADFMASSDNLENKVLDKVTLEAALRLLTRADRILFKLYRFGLSAKDIAKVLNSTEGAVNNKIYRIKKNLGRILSDGDG